MRSDQYESLGIRRLYLFVAGLVQERLLPPTTESVGDWTQHELEEASLATNYFASANFARALCYSPQFCAFLLWKNWLGAVYCAVLFVLHGLLVMVEHYKRSLCDHWMPIAPDTEFRRPEPEPEVPPGRFQLAPFETERFYRRIGLEGFRQFVTWVMSKLTYGFSGRKMQYIPQPNRTFAVAFERATRVSETVHLCSAVTVFPLVVFSWIRAPLGISLWTTFIMVSDILLALLQRFHRARIWPVLKRLLERHNK